MWKGIWDGLNCVAGMNVPEASVALFIGTTVLVGLIHFNLQYNSNLILMWYTQSGQLVQFAETQDHSFKLKLLSVSLTKNH
jgi:hypothetical protein